MADGAVIVFSPLPEDYLPAVFTRWEGMECYNYSPLIYANNCENIAITGQGLLKGNGAFWWHWKNNQQTAATELVYAESQKIPVSQRVYGTRKAALRPSFLQTINCQNIWLSDFTIEDGPQWMIHPVYCENMRIQNVHVKSQGPNTDGLNPDSCKNVQIDSCYFSTGDDCIAINSGMNEDGWRVNRPSENIVISNCRMVGGHGGLVIGSGMSGGVKNVAIKNCQIHETHQGIRLKSMRGRGGYVKNIWIEQIQMSRISREAIQINMYYGLSTVPPLTKTPPEFENIYMDTVMGNHLDLGIELIDLPEKPLKNIQLSNIQLETERSIVSKDLNGLSLSNVIISERGREGCEWKNVTGLKMENFKIN